MKRRICILTAQFCVCLIVCLAVFILRPLWRGMNAVKWIVPPLFSLFCAYFAVRKGVNPYLAWLPPPLALTAAGFAASMGFAPEGGLMLLCALMGIIGAAAGDESNVRKAKK
ncbi:MAG: hypothetical protein K5663_11740 [Clostridiales bacterium]|nr:hypothetical protein [Clostridiales bacterium]